MWVNERIAKLKLLRRGWVNYFRLGNIGSKVKAVDSWARNRLGYCIWTDGGTKSGKSQSGNERT